MAQLAPLTAESLRGRVVLVQFCTYTCINWLRTLPYVRAWAEKYAGQGLVVIGAHTPEFPFEKDLDMESRRNMLVGDRRGYHHSSVGSLRYRFIRAIA